MFCTPPTTMDYLGVALFHSLWQLGILAVIVAGLGLFSRSPRLNSLVGLVAILVAPFSVGVTYVAVSREWVAVQPCALLFQTAGDRTISSWISWTWLGGLCSGATCFLAAIISVVCLRRRSVSLPAGLLTQEIAGELREKVRIVRSRFLSAPVTIGWRKPLILIPQQCLHTLDARDLQILVAHEFAHVARRDFFWNLLQSITEALLFLHPAIWILSRCVRAEREFACDDLVLNGGVQRTEYAKTLAKLEQQRLQLRSLALNSGGAPLLSRILRMLTGRRSRRPNFCYAAGGAGLIAVTVFFFAQQPSTAAPQKDAMQDLDWIQVYCCP